MSNAWDKPHKALEDILDKRTVFYSVDADMNEVAIEGTVNIIYHHDGFWGEGEDYKSPTVVNPTWLQLAVFANEAINVTGDKHHIFFEGLRECGIELLSGVETYQFVMGS